MSTISSSIPTASASDVEVARRWFEALVAGEAATVTALLSDDIQLRELNPGGLETLRGGELRAFTDLFAHGRPKLLACEARAVGQRVQVTYSFEADGSWFEIHAFCDLAGGRLARIDQLCSGRLAG